MTRLTAQDHDRVAAAIRTAEARTSGEIYCVVAGESDSYFYPAALFALIGTLLAGTVCAIVLDFWWFSVRLPVFAIAQLLGSATVLLVLFALPSLRIRLVPAYLQHRRARDNALKQFLAHNVHVTIARTGILIFVSLAERYAEVIADSGIAEQVEQAHWNAIVTDLTEAARQGRLADGLVGAVGTSGALLAERFPPQSVERNELEDRVVEI
jgi:putative membrane protein